MKPTNYTGTLACLLALLFASAGTLAGVPTSQVDRLQIHAGTNLTIVLRGADARQQILVTGVAGTGSEFDFTRQVAYETAPSGIVRVGATGVVTPQADGETTLTARTTNGLTAKIQVKVEKFKSVQPINFANQIVPIFTKTGCNGGGCHGKSGGQNGFRLSLLGFEPEEDYEHLVKEARGRRLFPAAPEQSLLMLKGAAVLPHGGGKRWEVGSDDYRLVTRWIAQGMPYGRTNDPVVSHIEVLPKQRTLPLGSEQQLVVHAHYTDGSFQDVTRSALYEPNDKDMVKVSETGQAQFYRQPGDVGVMVRYQAKVAVFRGTIPLGAPVEKLPTAKNFVDEHVFRKLQTIGMPPSEPADDATFLRRSVLDIAGRLPTLDEARAFATNTDAAKREQWIDQLLGSAEYAENFASKWSALLRNKRTDSTHRRGTYGFYNWIRDGLFEKWSQQDYYSFAAFFSQVGRKPGAQPGEEMIYVKRTAAAATNKKTKQSVKPAGLGGPAQELSSDQDARMFLANWMTAKDNKFFARSLVNRYWKHFFNRGLVDPEDDMRETNPPSNPELLDALAKSFVDSGYDLKKLVRAICTSQTYQLSSTPNAHNSVDKQNYSRYYPRRLTAEALLDAVNVVTKAENRFDGLPSGTRAVQLPDNGFNANSYFLSVFGRPEASTSCECERSQDASLSQSLHLLNSKDVQEKIGNDKGTAAALAGDSRTPDDEKVRDLYLLACSRLPDEKELSIARGHVEKQTAGKTEKELATGRRQAYEDIIWALINTKEFLFNH